MGGLRALHERDDAARLPAGLVPRIRRILFRLQDWMRMQASYELAQARRNRTAAERAGGVSHA